MEQSATDSIPFGISLLCSNIFKQINARDYKKTLET
jgi:hypothetical protein